MRDTSQETQRCVRCDSDNTLLEIFDETIEGYSWEFECYDCGLKDVGEEC